MRKGGGKPKGNSFEGAVAKDLSLWFTDGERSDIFDRNSSSGAKATVYQKAGVLYKDQAGDIVSVSREGYPLTNLFIIECKHHRDLNLIGLLFGTREGLPKFWKKLLQQCNDFSKLPMLVARQNNRKTLLCLDDEGVEILKCEELLVAEYVKLGMSTMYFDDLLHNVPSAKLRERDDERQESKDVAEVGHGRNGGLARVQLRKGSGL